MIDALMFINQPPWVPNPPRSIGERKVFGEKWQSIKTPPHPLGRHPFNILTEEIYDD